MLALLAFLSGLAIAAGGLLLSSLNAPAALGGVAWFVLVVGAALPVLRDVDRQVRAFAQMPALLFMCAVPVAWFARQHEAPEAVTLVLIAIAAIAAARTIRSLLLYSGVQRMKRLHLMTSFLVGATFVVPLMLLVHAQQEIFMAAALACVILAGRRSVKRAVAVSPERERWFGGLVTTVAVLVLGASITATAMLVVARFFGPARGGVHEVPVLLSGPLCALAAGTLFAPLVKPTKRRSGVAIGSATLVAVGAVGASFHWFQARLATDPPFVWGLLTLGVPGLVVGCALPVLCRYTIGIPRGSMIIADVEAAQRPTLDGAVLRVGALLIGAASAPALSGSLALHRWMITAAAAAAVVLLLDPRAGAGQKAFHVIAAGAAAAIGIGVMQG